LVKTLLLGMLFSMLGVIVGDPYDPNIVATKVRFGNLSAFDKSQGHTLAIVDSKKVYKEISEYKIIIKENLKVGTARYSMLIQKCTKKFRSACQKLSTSKGYTLIVEVGGVGKYTPPDETSTLISLIGS
tara:strand:+ start:172 stop:558 length:387 start_codon:yes stop_codon:yes gene_type:complete